MPLARDITSALEMCFIVKLYTNPCLYLYLYGRGTDTTEHIVFPANAVGNNYRVFVLPNNT